MLIYSAADSPLLTIRSEGGYKFTLRCRRFVRRECGRVTLHCRRFGYWEHIAMNLVRPCMVSPPCGDEQSNLIDVLSGEGSAPTPAKNSAAVYSEDLARRGTPEGESLPYSSLPYSHPF